MVTTGHFKDAASEGEYTPKAESDTTCLEGARYPMDQLPNLDVLHQPVLLPTVNVGHCHKYPSYYNSIIITWFRSMHFDLWYSHLHPMTRFWPYRAFSLICHSLVANQKPPELGPNNHTYILTLWELNWSPQPPTLECLHWLLFSQVPSTKYVPEQRKSDFESNKSALNPQILTWFPTIWNRTKFSQELLSFRPTSQILKT